MLVDYKVFILVASLLQLVRAEDEVNSRELYRASPKLTGPAELAKTESGLLLRRLDEALAKISTVYMQSLFDGEHTAEMDAEMRQMEIDLYDMLNQLYQHDQLSDFMRYEANVTRQLVVYNLLKQLFGFGGDEENS